MNNWQLTVGLEVHVELETTTKMFCGCKNDPFNSPPNANICPICLGLPGALPLINRSALQQVLKLGRALGGKIGSLTFWARKNYFYPDLPKGYQISQSSSPLITEAKLTIDGQNHPIKRIHLEEDTGKLTHRPDERNSSVDFNRAGVPLLEIVTEPDFHSSRSAKRFCQELQTLLRQLEISPAEMEKGQMRCEANISVSKPTPKNHYELAARSERQRQNPKRGEAKKTLGTKVEVKNINSFRAVERAIEYEFERQTKVLEAEGEITQETRTWSESRGQTVPMRSKETSADYRYFPEPDLPIVSLEGKLPKPETAILPEAQRRELQEVGISPVLIRTLVEKGLFNSLMKVARIDRSSVSEAAKLSLEQPAFGQLAADRQIELLKARRENGWSKQIVKKVIDQALLGQRSLEEITADYVSRGDIRAIGREIIDQQTKAVEDFRRGRGEALNFLIGQLMARTKGRVNVGQARQVLAELLGELD